MVRRILAAVRSSYFFNVSISNCHIIFESPVIFNEQPRQVICGVTHASRAASSGATHSVARLATQQGRHNASSPPPIKEAAILTLDGVGESATASCGIGRGN